MRADRKKAVKNYEREMKIPEMNKINIDNPGELNNMIAEICRKTLQEDYDALKDYFKRIIDKKYDSMVFISRRCYILFQIFALSEGWDYKSVLTDLGLFASRKQLKNCKKVIVVDDIGFTGMSMRGVITRINKYVRRTCKIDGILYSVCENGIDQNCNIKLGLGRSVKVKVCLQLTERQCQELSCKLVSVILATGMPYSTFVYPIWGEKRAEMSLPEIGLDTRKAILNEVKWNTSYMRVSDVPGIDKVGTFPCIRVYRAREDNRMYFLPFLFLKRMDSRSMMLLFENVADIFRELGELTIAEEIQGALHVKAPLKKDAMEYLASLLICICSKGLAEIKNLNDYVNSLVGIVRSSLCGSFTEECLAFLMRFNEKSAQLFFQKLHEKMKDVEISSVKTEKSYIYYDELKEYVLKNPADNAYAMLSDIFQWMKEKSLKNGAECENIRSISVDELMQILQDSGRYSDEDLYIAQIECWDRGIATYRFYFSEKSGLIAKCSIGEMSAAITALRYQKLIRDFYNQEFLYKGIVTGKIRAEILEHVIENALERGEYTEQEIQRFRKIYEERNGSLYEMII